MFLIIYSVLYFLVLINNNKCNLKRYWCQTVKTKSSHCTNGVFFTSTYRFFPSFHHIIPNNYHIFYCKICKCVMYK